MSLMLSDNEKDVLLRVHRGEARTQYEFKTLYGAVARERELRRREAKVALSESTVRHILAKLTSEGFLSSTKHNVRDKVEYSVTEEGLKALLRSDYGLQLEEYKKGLRSLEMGLPMGVLRLAASMPNGIDRAEVYSSIKPLQREKIDGAIELLLSEGLLVAGGDDDPLYPVPRVSGSGLIFELMPLQLGEVKELAVPKIQRTLLQEELRRSNAEWNRAMNELQAGVLRRRLESEAKKYHLTRVELKNFEEEWKKLVDNALEQESPIVPRDYFWRALKERGYLLDDVLDDAKKGDEAYKAAYDHYMGEKTSQFQPKAIAAYERSRGFRKGIQALGALIGKGITKTMERQLAEQT